MRRRIKGATTSRVYLAPVSFGLGDLVVSLPPLQALIDEASRTGGETWLVTRSDSQARLAGRVSGLTGCVAEDAFDRKAGGRFFNLRDHPLQRDYWWGSAEFEAAFGRLSINDILARICADFAIDADFSRPIPLRAQQRPDLSASVLLVAETDGPTKQWPVDRWSALAAAIRTLDLEPRLVTRANASPVFARTGIKPIHASNLGRAVDILSAARAVVGIDTGLTHIAAQQQTPTVTICRANNVFFRQWSHTRAAVGDACDEACMTIEKSQAHNARVDLRGFRWRPRPCPVGGRCLEAVGPGDVMHVLEQLL